MHNITHLILLTHIQVSGKTHGHKKSPGTYSLYTRLIIIVRQIAFVPPTTARCVFDIFAADVNRQQPPRSGRLSFRRRQSKPLGRGV